MKPTVRRLAAVLPAALLTAGLPLAGGPAAAGDGASPGGGVLRLAPEATAVPGSWIVVLREDAEKPGRGGALELLDTVGGSLGQVYDSALPGFTAVMSEEQARSLADDPAVAYVEQNTRITTQDTQESPPSWGVDRVDQRALPLDDRYTYDSTGAGVTAYVIDTGIRTSHQDFGGRARSGYDFVDDDAVAQDCHGHGTHVAGTIGGTGHGVAKGVSLVGVRVLDCAGSGTTADVIAGVDWVTENATGPAVANMSLGGGVQQALDDAVRRSIASGVTYATAAGNGNILGLPQNACHTSPARVEEALTVGATDASDRRASFSNYGSCLDLFAPGVDIVSASAGGDTATDTLSGTSMATPHVAGGAARYLSEHPGATPAQVRDAVVGDATEGAVGNPAYGSPNLLLHTGS
ncbi:S8 family peptidase [Streptomyces sp. JJ36]|uniref:S8 family peptidase n=1 Tax=Streptomyces sp. JJ36 TaxID=2736645 RepID=UPI001F384D04|nr:S8 family peptidase [Streptomyces sp. JJ36]MCF6526117.1 S8 family peptidase [Streptomyces sp. JJ36]